MYWLISIGDYHEDAKHTPMYWCGYISGPGRTHVWKKGVEGFREAIRFSRQEDAVRAGVSGPNTAYVKGEDQVDKGVKILGPYEEQEGR